MTVTQKILCEITLQYNISEKVDLTEFLRKNSDNKATLQFYAKKVDFTEFL